MGIFVLWDEGWSKTLVLETLLWKLRQAKDIGPYVNFKEHLTQPLFLTQKEMEAQSETSKAKTYLAGQGQLPSPNSLDRAQGSPHSVFHFGRRN